MIAAPKEVSDLGSRIIKVDHAGEQGAICIYTGQIIAARLTAKDLIPTLVEFRDHERRHRGIFSAELKRRGVPRCRSYYLCAVGGFVLGITTGILGRHAIAATTIAVERVVLRHLEEQIAQLSALDPRAAAAIQEIHAEEKMHHDLSESQVAADAFWLRVLSPLVSAATESVIWLGLRL